MRRSMEDGDMDAVVQKPQDNQRKRRPSRLLVWAIASTLLVLSLALGLGLGLSLKHHGAAPATTPRPRPPTPTAVWQPAVGASWQIVLSQVLDIDDNNPRVEPDAEVFDIDMFLHQNSTVIENLHKLGKKVICYFSAGSYEPDRPDAYKFQSSDLGADLKGWPGERWVNISSPSIREIIAARVETASQMGCDAIDPDNVDGYQNNNGLSLTSDDSVELIDFIVDRASERKIAVGLKNAPDIIPDVISLVQFAVNEQCAEYDVCGATRPFIKANKPVFHIEYPPDAPSVSKAQSDDACTSRGSSSFSTIMKTLTLDGWAQYCDDEVVAIFTECLSLDATKADPSKMFPGSSHGEAPFILLPLYIYPSPKAWEPLLSMIATSKSGFLVVVNPNNGPGRTPTPDNNYIAALTALSAAPNVKILGYVFCDYGNRPLADLEGDIRQYHTWTDRYCRSSTFPEQPKPLICHSTAIAIRIDGIFFDEAPFKSQHVELMAMIANFTRLTFQQGRSCAGSPPTVIYNPGVFAHPSHYESADYIVVFENEVGEWDSSYVEANLAKLPEDLRRRSVAIGHSAMCVEQQLKFVDKVVTAGLAGHFATAVPGYTEFCPNWQEYVRYADKAGKETLGA
ncbi:hypothetical protein OQA88_8611 [Cercophora sp. LCS_1]